MKRFVAILMLFVYSLSISGMAIQLHFCDGNISSVNLISKADGDNCCCSPSKKKQAHKKSCCGETTATLKVNIDQSQQHQVAQFKIISINPFDVVLWNSNDLVSSFVNFDNTKKYINISNDIGRQKIPLYKLFGSIVYYG